MKLVLLIPLLDAAGAPVAPPQAASPADPVAQYLGDLERAGVVRPKDAALAGLRQGLVDAEQDLVTGNVQTATTNLFALVESDAFVKFKNDPEYQNAELTLGRALVKGGAYGAAEHFLGRVLKRGREGPFFTPAYRAKVDVALETRAEGDVLGRLAALCSGPRLPRDSANE